MPLIFTQDDRLRPQGLEVGAVSRISIEKEYNSTALSVISGVLIAAEIGVGIFSGGATAALSVGAKALFTAGTGLAFAGSRYAAKSAITGDNSFGFSEWLDFGLPVLGAAGGAIRATAREAATRAAAEILIKESGGIVNEVAIRNIIKTGATAKQLTQLTETIVTQGKVIGEASIMNSIYAQKKVLQDIIGQPISANEFNTNIQKLCKAGQELYINSRW